MKILLMSDSHGRNAMVDHLLEKHNDADLFIHCGDIECDEYVFPALETVAGNNDVYYDYPSQRIFTVHGHRILVLHSHQCMFYYKRSQWLRDTAIENHCDIVFYGHTHVAKDETLDGIRLVNPGSLRYSRDGRSPSYAIVIIEDDVNVQFYFEPFD